MTALSVNVNKIALLRNARVGKGPDVVKLARLALEAGAHGITVHPRPDERHITHADTRDLATMIRDEFPDREYNIEGNPFEGQWMQLVLETRPDQATLVPDDPNQSTSDHGFRFPDDV
ncbi:MAG: pyridoxine 5'-phosphate synthase, partial [Planctomycetota bacterium]